MIPQQNQPVKEDTPAQPRPAPPFPWPGFAALVVLCATAIAIAYIVSN